ncbi:MAG TPA: DUF4038 domain-containing protein, partial [Lacipirellulaceae bacterium]
PAMPVLNSEVSYEALLDRIPADVPRLLFWTNILSGAAGHTYGANGIWQVNRKGQPYGNSPHGGNYGTLPWDEAMKLPGSQHMDFAKRLLERYPWHRFEPHLEWATWSENSDQRPPTDEQARADEFIVPYAAGVPGSVRVIYLPKPWPVTVNKLEQSERYTARFFNPTNGGSRDIGPVQPGVDGSWTSAPPTNVPADWVLILEASEDQR